MKLWIFSDLHRDFADWTPWYAPPADVCVVAGDVGEGLAKSVRWLQKHIVDEHGLPVVFVAGNHEFYRSSIDEAWMEARAAEADCPGVHLLQDESVVLGGTRFLGATLWTDYEILHTPDNSDPALHLRWAMSECGARMNDHKRITYQKKPWKRWRPHEARMAHMRSRNWLDAELAQPHDGPTVVVTHHAPHRGSIPERFARDVVTSAYASDLSGLIERHRPAGWVHGHMHDTCDYRVGETAVVCNPRGYGSENGAFVGDFVVEV